VPIQKRRSRRRLWGRAQVELSVRSGGRGRADYQFRPDCPRSIRAVWSPGGTRRMDPC